MARKCSLPARAPLPGTDVLPEDGPPKEVSVERIEKYALQSFFYEYSILTVNSSLSGGFLARLESMVKRSGLKSPLADACRAAAFASGGLKLHRKYILDWGKNLYQDSIQHLAKLIRSSSATTPETLAIAILLGLYQVM